MVWAAGNSGVIAWMNTIDAERAAWTAYTPTFRTAGGAVVLGNGTMAGRWLLVGKTVTFWAQLTIGSTTGLNTGQMIVNVPAAARATAELAGLHGIVNSGTRFDPLSTTPASATEVTLIANGAVIAFNAPATFTTGNFVIVRGEYETP